MPNDKLSKLETELHAIEKKLKAAENDERYYLRELQYLTRKERIYRLSPVLKCWKRF